MKQYNIDLEKVIISGNVDARFINNILHVTTYTQNNHFYQFELPINSYIQIPQKYKLPLQIDIRIKIDAPSMYLIFGKGHLTFGTSFLDNRRIGDIIELDAKKTAVFDNRLEINAFTDLTVVYETKFMRISVNDEERFYSKKEKYIKSPLLENANTEGFDLKIAGSKQTSLAIASITVTEFDADELASLRSGQEKSDKSRICLSIDKKVKSDFEECISMLSPELQSEIKDLDDYLLNHKNLKVKRKIEGTSQACKISYVSSHGFSYSVHVSENIVDHFFWWYMVSNYTYENKYMGRKNDLTIETLNKVAETSPDIAEQLFSYYDECVGCNKNCSVVRTLYEYSGKKKAVCHGKMIMNMNASTFHNTRRMFKALNEILT